MAQKKLESRGQSEVGKKKLVHREAYAGDKDGDLWKSILDDLDDSDSRVRKDKVERVKLATLNIDVPDNTIMVANLGDLHWGSNRTSHNLIKDYFQWVKDNGAYVNLLGDLGQGFNELFVDTVAASLVDNPDVQWRKIYRLITHLRRDEKLLSLLSSREHEQWLLKKTGVDGYNRLHNRGYYLASRGKENLHYPDGRTEVIALSHKPGGGGSEQNPLAPIDKLAAENQADFAQTAHHHSRAGAGIKVKLNGERRALGASGSFLGQEEGLEDELLLENGVRPAPPGLVTVNSGGLGIYPFNDRDAALKYYDAARIWEQAEKLGVTRELLGEIWAKSPGDKSERISLITKGPEASHKSSSEHDEDTPYWKELNYRVPGTLPFQVYWLAGLRAGHRTADYQQFKRILATASESNRTYLYGGRLMVDRGTADDTRRRTKLRTMTDAARGDFKGSPYKLTGVLDKDTNDPRWLAFMRDGALLRTKWDKVAKDEYMVSEPFDASNYIQERLDVPLIDNKGVLSFQYATSSGRRERTTVRVFDNMEQSSGRRVTYMGTVAMVENDVLDGNSVCDIYNGNTMPGAGVYSLYSQGAGRFIQHVNAGNLAEWQRGSSRTNNQPSVESGQSSIIDPETGTVYFGATLEHSRDSFNALTLRSGAETVLTDRELRAFSKRLGITQKTYHSMSRDLLNSR